MVAVRTAEDIDSSSPGAIELQGEILAALRTAAPQAMTAEALFAACPSAHEQEQVYQLLYRLSVTGDLRRTSSYRPDAEGGSVYLYSLPGPIAAADVPVPAPAPAQEPPTLRSRLVEAVRAAGGRATFDEIAARLPDVARNKLGSNLRAAVRHCDLRQANGRYSLLTAEAPVSAPPAQPESSPEPLLSQPAAEPVPQTFRAELLIRFGRPGEEHELSLDEAAILLRCLDPIRDLLS